MKMTNSLLNAYTWYCKCPTRFKDSALQAIRNTLTQQFTGNVATERGDCYEKSVNTRILSAPFTGVEEPLNLLKGMAQQQWLKRFDLAVPHNGTTMQITFRGRMDYCGVPVKPYLPEWAGKRAIYDLKTTASEVVPSRYETGFQHVIYALAENITIFVYFVAKFDGESDLTPTSITTIPIDMTKNLDQCRERLVNAVSGLLKLMNDMGMWQDYITVFNR